MSASSYNRFLTELKSALESRDTDEIDSLMYYANSWELDEDEIDDLSELITEATLYMESGDDDYREMALVMIQDREE